MKNFRINKFSYRRDRLKFLAKLTLFTIMFWFVLNIVINIKHYSFYADIVKYSTSLITKEVLLAKMDQIKDTSPNWPLKQVTNWWSVTNYEQTKWTNWTELSDDLKTNFPQWDISSIISKYQRVNLYNMYDHVFNAWEREVLTFYRRLFWALWTASYCVSKDSCNSWVPDSGTHAWIDLITSIWTPIYSSMNWVVMKACQEDSCDSFGNQLVVATNFDWEVYATFYGHLNSLASTYSEGDIVTKWQLIWYVWSSGNSTVPHLHLQINKLWTVSEIKTLNIAKQLYDGWYWDLAWIRKSTIDPLTFIQTKTVTKSDSFVDNSTSSSSSSSSADLISAIQDEVETTTTVETPAYTAPTQQFKLVSVKANKIDTKLTAWDVIKVIVNTKWESWTISIVTNNDVLKVSENVISPNGSNSYEILVTANSLWNWEINFSDWETKKTLSFSVYDTDMNVYGLEIKWDNTIYKTYESEYVIYPIDKLWNRIFTNLEWTFTFNLYNKSSGVSTKITQFTNSDKDASIVFKLKAPDIGTYKLKVSYDDSKKSLMATKNLTTDLFFDYSINNTYWKSINYLFTNWIVKWHEWLLMPNNTITRAEIITTLVRQKYGDKFDDFKKEMNSYVAKNGKIFKDMKSSDWFAPYVYIWWKNGIVKWTNWYSNANDVITRAELIAILWRTYNVEVSDPYTSWDDVLYDDWFKTYADASKKYNLFPFDNLNKFAADNKVNRIQAFESLYRYLTIDTSILNYTSTAVTNTQKVEVLVKTLIKF